MRYGEKQIQARDGRKFILRSPEEKDAETMIAYLKQTNTETVFLTMYPEEITLTLEKEQEILADYLNADNKVMITIFDGERALGNAGISPISPKFKVRHRAGLGIALCSEIWEQGLGTLLLTEALSVAEGMGYEQVELGVYSENRRARHLYEKSGFREIGRIPNAFKLKDGTYQDEILMVKQTKN